MRSTSSRLCGVVIGVYILLCSLVSAQSTYEVLDNTPFETRVRGIAGVIAVDSSGVRNANQLRWRTQYAIRDAEWRLRRTRPRVVHFLRRYGFWRGKRIGIDMLAVAVEPRSKRILTTSSLSAPARAKRVFGTGKVEFEFIGFRKEVAESLRNWLNSAMPTLIEVYGNPVSTPPGSTRKVKIILDTTLDALDGGVYSPSTDEIRISNFEGRNFDYFNLVHHVLHAFRGPLVLSYPAWEEGMARAAAIIATKKLLPKFDPSDPMDGDPLFLMPLYDLLNQPPLGNPLFIPPSGYQTMAFWRYGMSAAAWLKVAVEDEGFFRKFNETYYSRYNERASTPLSGNVPALKYIASRIVKQVEGMDFYDWYRRQWVLDTSVRSGFKLYVFNVPLEIGVLIAICYYRTTPDGNEIPLNALAQLIYSNDMSDDLYAEEGNEAEIFFGDGFIAPQFFNIGGPNLIRIDIAVEGMRTVVYFPYNVRGEINKENPIFGGLVGADSGQVVVKGDGVSESVNVSRGVFAITSGVDLNGLRKFTIEHMPLGGITMTEHRNMCFGFYVLMLNGRASVVTVEKVFKRGWHLFGVPVIPIKTDEADILGIPKEKLLLAHWQPNLVGVSRYEVYPNISTPMHPGVGYWLLLDSDYKVTVQGTPTPADEPFEIPLLGGFNQLANPFPFPISVNDFMVVYKDGEPLSLQTASQMGYIDPNVWIWTQEEGYKRATTIEPWSGFWVRSLQPVGVWLIIPPVRAKSNGR
ncbi:MAG: hypothetical protein RUDDFDWM_000315 [Candidatus Fervidibacterota bacterium]